ncbi:hypothetical protein BJ742DRAFT_802523 [Cladochytrium replicatum]|nr:hypothetical protein BJ742DRAFT_802523 [Cladochytrium replicatum]
MSPLQPTVLHDDALSGLETAEDFVLVDAFHGNAHQERVTGLLEPSQLNPISASQKTTEKALNPTFFWTMPHVLSATTLIDDDDDAFTTATEMSSSWLGSVHSADHSPNCNPETVGDDVVPMDLSEGEISEEEEDSGQVSATGSEGSGTTLVLAEKNIDATGMKGSEFAGDSLMPPPPPPPPLLLHQRRSMKLKRTREPSASSVSFPDAGSPTSSVSGASTATSSPAAVTSASLLSSGDSPPMPGLQTNPDLTTALSGLTVADSPMLLHLPPRPEGSQGKEIKQQHPPKRRASSTALQALSVPHTTPSVRRASTSIPSQGTPSRVIFSHHHRQSPSSSSLSSDVAISNYNTLKRTEPLTTAAKKCDFCGATSTPMWRHGPIPFFVLCNSCGVKWKRGKILQDMPPMSLAGSQTDDESHGGRGRSVSRRRSRVAAPVSKDASATNPTVTRRRSSVSTPSKVSSHHMARRNSVPTTPTSAKKDLLTSHLRDANDAQLATFVDAICGGVPGLDTELAVAGEVEVDIGRLDEDVWRKVCEALMQARR